MALIKVSEVKWIQHPFFKNDFTVEFSDKERRISVYSDPSGLFVPHVVSEMDNFDVENKLSLDDAKEEAIQKAIELGLLEDDREKKMKASEIVWEDTLKYKFGSLFFRSNGIEGRVEKWMSHNKGQYFIFIPEPIALRFDGSELKTLTIINTIEEAKELLIAKLVELGLLVDDRKTLPKKDWKFAWYKEFSKDMEVCGFPTSIGHFDFVADFNFVTAAINGNVVFKEYSKGIENGKQILETWFSTKYTHLRDSFKEVKDNKLKYEETPKDTRPVEERVKEAVENFHKRAAMRQKGA